MDVTIITTSDGSHSLRNEALNETYHSIHGALQESLHVFINNGLDFYVRKNQATSIRILEIGFGTGLNALLALQYAQQHGIKTHYATVEAFPLEQSLTKELNYPEMISLPGAREYFELMHICKWEVDVSVAGMFTLRKIHSDVLTLEGLPQCDIIFYDAFGASRQPAMWSKDVIEKVIKSLAPNGLLATYCAMGQFKRDLKSLGLTVETLPGPPGKLQMVRATRQ